MNALANQLGLTADSTQCNSSVCLILSVHLNTVLEVGLIAEHF